MRKSKFTEHQIDSSLKQREAGVNVAGLGREHGIGKYYGTLDLFAQMFYIRDRLIELH